MAAPLPLLLLATVAAAATTSTPAAATAATPGHRHHHGGWTGTASAQAWRGSSMEGLDNWPEQKIAAIAGRPLTGIAFSGGGSRSYAVSLSYIAALHELGLMDNVRYVTGISGGSWATAVYAYARQEYCCADCAQRCGGARAPLNLTRLLGERLPPAGLTMQKLRRMAPGSALEAPTRDLYGTVAKYALELQGDEIWYRTVDEVYLAPVGIPYGKGFSWSNATAAEVVARNPSLSTEQFVTVRDADAAPSPWPAGMPPFPIIGSTLLGPKALAPFPSKNRSYTLLEMTPLYVGSPVARNVTYFHWHMLRPHEPTALNRTVGGYIEPFAFGGAPPPNGLSADQNMALLEVPAPASLFSLAMAAGDSSFAPGSVLANDFLDLSEWLNLLGMTLPYWSPNAPHPNAEPTLGGSNDPQSVYADGGIVENLAIIGLIRRNVTSIIACFNSDSALETNRSWDPNAEPPRKSSMDADIPAYFGINVPQIGQDEHRDQVFARADFPRVAVALQAAQARGNGVVVTTQHVTVENRWWGVSAGLKVNVTWMLLGRALNWEAELPEKLRKEVRPSGREAEDPSKLVGFFSAFHNFPLYDTGTQQTLSTEQVNLLGSLSQWVVRANSEQLRSALAPAS